MRIEMVPIQFIGHHCETESLEVGHLGMHQAKCRAYRPAGASDICRGSPSCTATSRQTTRERAVRTLLEHLARPRLLLLSFSLYSQQVAAKPVVRLVDRHHSLVPLITDSVNRTHRALCTYDKGCALFLSVSART